MGWVAKKNRLPPETGWYNVIKFHPGTAGLGFFKAVPPWKSSEYMQWKNTMKLEEDCVDRCIYLKYKAFFDLSGIEQKPEEILYWYELDPLVEDENE